MDGLAPDLLLKELRRIKWLLLLILLTLLSLPVFLLYVGWEVASLLQENTVEEEADSVETTADASLRRALHRDGVSIVSPETMEDDGPLHKAGLPSEREH